MLRVVTVVAGLVCALPAVGGEMTASEARHFVVGKLFRYTCFDGTRGMARAYDDGSVDGFIQVQGTGLPRYGTMPVGTLRADGERAGKGRADDFTLHQEQAHVKQPVQHRPLPLTTDK